MEFIIHTYAFIATVPFLSFFLLYAFFSLIDKTKKKAFNLSVHITSILLYTAVTAQIKLVFHWDTGFILTLLWVILIMSTLGFLQWKIRGEFNYTRIFTSTFKLSFVSFGLFYILFFFVGYFKL